MIMTDSAPIAERPARSCLVLGAKDNECPENQEDIGARLSECGILFKRNSTMR